MNNWKNGRITGMSSACQFADYLQSAHAERMRRQREQERYNEESLARFNSNCRAVAKGFIWAFVGLCALYIAYGVAVGMGWLS
jgi:hypothetical protein